MRLHMHKVDVVRIPLETAAETTSGKPDYRLQDVHEPFGYRSELVFPPSCSKLSKRAPLQGSRATAEIFFGGGCEILDKAPGFRRYSSFCHCFQEKVGEILDRSIFPSHPLTEHSPPHYPTAPHPTWPPPINSYHLYVLPNSLFYICGFFRPVVAYFLPL